MLIRLVLPSLQILDRLLFSTFRDIKRNLEENIILISIILHFSYLLPQFLILFAHLEFKAKFHEFGWTRIITKT